MTKQPSAENLREAQNIRENYRASFVYQYALALDRAKAQGKIEQAEKDAVIAETHWERVANGEAPKFQSISEAIRAAIKKEKEK